MSDRNEEQTSSKKVNNFLDKNKKILWTILIVAVVALIAFICITTVSNSTAKKNIEKIDAISFALTDNSSALEETELNAKRDATIEALVPFTKKSGVAGVRANLLCAELSYQKEDYETAMNYYKAVAAKDKKAYTAPLAYFNVAACYEKLNNFDAAAENYKKAADNNDFVLQAHAKFSYGRVLEQTGKIAEAVVAYNELNDKFADTQWANLGKTRVIALQAAGKTE